MLQLTFFRVGKLALAISASFMMGKSVEAEELDVTIYEFGGDGQAAECTLSKVSGLKDDGDGFLSVRTGPGTSYRKFDELHNGDYVITFYGVGDWVGVYYGRGEELLGDNEIGCGYVGEGKRPVPYPGKKGWVHGNWLELVAG